LRPGGAAFSSYSPPRGGGGPPAPPPPPPPRPAALARWQRAWYKAVRYETELVPAQRGTLDSALASYRVGRAEFESLYRAEVELLGFERVIVGEDIGSTITAG
jgi:hypothetical protein